MRLADNIRPGMIGTDNGHEFTVIDTDIQEVKIRYESDGSEHWFQDNRFYWIGESLELI